MADYYNSWPVEDTENYIIKGKKKKKTPLLIVFYSWLYLGRVDISVPRANTPSDKQVKAVVCRSAASDRLHLQLINLETDNSQLRRRRAAAAFDPRTDVV